MSRNIPVISEEVCIDTYKTLQNLESCDYYDCYSPRHEVDYGPRREERYNPRQKELCETTAIICKSLNKRWHPPYINVLPESVLINILVRLDMFSAQQCFRVCKGMRASMLKALNWKQVGEKRTEIFSGIHKLPVEVMIQIFSYLDTPTLQSCLRASKSWHCILIRNTAVWAGKATFGPRIKSVPDQWKKLQQFLRGSKLASISVNLDRSLKVIFMNTEARLRHSSRRYLSAASSTLPTMQKM